MITISWTQFEHNQSAKDVNFEAFCFQVAFSLYKNYGRFESFFNTPGSEFYLHLTKDCSELNATAGDIIGWQVKWWFNSEDNSSLTSNRRDELTDNFRTTVKEYPRIGQWIICTPGAFDQKAFKKLVLNLHGISASTSIVHWSKTTFNNFRAVHYDILGPIFHHYFNAKFIGLKEIRRFSETKLRYLENKFDTDLYAATENDATLMGLLDLKSIYFDLQAKARYLFDALNKIERRLLDEETDFPEYKKEFINEVLELRSSIIQRGKEVHALLSQTFNIEQCKNIRDYLDTARDLFRKSADRLNRQMELKEHLKIEREEGRHHEDWAFTSSVLDPIKTIFQHLYGSKPNTEQHEDEQIEGIYAVLSKTLQKDVHILSGAGYGKTNIVCNLCNSLLEKQIPSVLILGSSFRIASDPKYGILAALSLSESYSFTEFIQALNNLGLVKGYKIPLIIDGLNESTPYDGVWKMYIKDIIEEVSRFDYVLFVTTCRDRYIESIFETNDVQSIPHTMLLHGLQKKSLDTAIRKYFTKYHIEPSSWAFNKTLFSNPLLLKIFSEVNENKQNITISLASLFKSIDSYIDKIESKASQANSSTDPILKRKVGQGLQKVCARLWESNFREMSLLEFHELIDPDKGSLTGSLTERLLDEGLCFQKNLTGSDETVQFTYDLVAGYCIAARHLLPNMRFEGLTFGNVDLKKELDNKVFVGGTDHALRQDILMAMIYLFPERLGVQLFEIIKTDNVIEEMFNSIDYIIDKPEAQERLFETIKKQDFSGRNFKLLFEKLFEAIYQKEIHGLGSFTLRVLNLLNQVQIDIYWTELLRKQLFDVKEVLLVMNRAYRWSKAATRSPKEDRYLSILATVSIDKEIRSKATENLYLIGRVDTNELFSLVDEVVSVKDVNMTESLIAGVCGTVLALQSKAITQDALKVLDTIFIPLSKTTHICIYDYIEIIKEFAQQYLEITEIPKLEFNHKNFPISLIRKSSDGANSRFADDYPAELGIDIYDFNKHQISSISNSGYRKVSSYSKSQCLAVLINQIRSKGFDESTRNFMEEEYKEPEERSYPRKMKGSYKEYVEKYLMQSFYEFVGYLHITNDLKADEELPRYRSSQMIFDPCFPVLPPKFN